jgi:Fic family protein
MQIQQKKGFYHLMQSYRTEVGKIEIFDQYIGKNKPDRDQIETFIYQYSLKRWKSKLDDLISLYQNRFNNLSPTLNSKNLRTFGIRFTHNTNKIEGSTLSERDTTAILEDGIVPTNSVVNDVIETKAHMRVYELMINNHQRLSIELIKSWHNELFHNTKPIYAGDFRNGPVAIAGSKYIPPTSRDEIDILMDDLLRWYEDALKLKKNPVYIAAILHLRFVSIHPFEDGNGRITRLLMNYVLFHHQYPMFDLNPTQRYAYYNALQNANMKEDETYFIGWFFSNYCKYIQNTLNKWHFNESKPTNS